MRARGRDIQKEARRLVAWRALSRPGEYPGRDSGTLWRSIKSKVSRSGFLVRIAPQKTPEMGKDFYPAFLWYGVRRQGGEQGSGWRIEPRENYMTVALDKRREVSENAIKAALKDALIPR
ncbi:hypothetical protein [Caballeronia novacaledonica]|nr:hypothetical protein [Caballeronia novacaledonica]